MSVRLQAGLSERARRPRAGRPRAGLPGEPRWAAVRPALAPSPAAASCRAPRRGRAAAWARRQHRLGRRERVGGTIGLGGGSQGGCVSPGDCPGRPTRPARRPQRQAEPRPDQSSRRTPFPRQPGSIAAAVVPLPGAAAVPGAVLVAWWRPGGRSAAVTLTLLPGLAHSAQPPGPPPRPPPPGTPNGPFGAISTLTQRSGIADHNEASLLSRGFSGFLRGCCGRAGVCPPRGRRVVSGPGVAWPKSRCSGCEPAALATESLPGCPPGPSVLPPPRRGGRRPAGGRRWRR